MRFASDGLNGKLRPMRSRISWLPTTLALALAITGIFSAGCKSTPKIDWNTRVGNYTYEEAVAEFGPPDKKETLDDGTVVADWITRGHSGVSFGIGTGYWGGHSGVGVGQSVSSGGWDHVMRLTFGPDKKLVAWKKS